MKLYRIILLFLLFLAAPILHAQQTDAQRWNEKISKGIEFKDSGKHDSAVFYLKAALEIAQRTFAKTDEKVIYNTHHLGEVYLEIEEFELAQEAIILTLNATESSKGKQHADYRFCLSRLALSYELMKDYSSALKLYKESLQNTKNNKGTNHQDYREELTNLANYYTRRRDLNNAVKVYLDLLENIELHLGREHVSYGSNQYQLGHLYYRMEDYDMALSAYSEDLEGVEKRLGKTNSTYIDRLWMLAGLHEKRKEYKIAADLYLEQLELTEEVFGKNKSYMYDIGSVAKLYESLGEYEKALPLYLDALEVTGKILGTDHFRYGDCLNNIAVLYERLGENTKALRLHTEALNVTESVLGKEHERYGTSLNNIGLLYSQAGDNEKALPLFLEALRIEQKVFGKSRSDYGVCVSNLANLYRSTGDYTKALPFFYEALENFENTLGKEHFRYGQTLNALALSYQSFGDYTKAAKLYSEALKNTEQSVGKNHETFGHVLINQAGMYEIIAEYERAQNNHLEANRNLLYQIRQIFKFRSEEEQKAFLKTALFRFDAAQSFGYNLENHFSSITEMNLNNQLLLKGLLLNSSKNVFEELRGLNDKETHKKLTTYRNQKTLLAKQYSLPVSKRIIDTDSLAELCNYQEAELVRLYQNEFKDNTSLSRDWKEIWAQLKPDELAIEFSHFDYRNNKEWTDSTLYVAYLIKKEWTAPKTVYLFEQQQLKSVLSHKTPNQLYATRGASVEDNGAAVLFADSIYNLVWKKLEPELGGVKTIYYATDGLL
ncbi:MAG: tetratricopeptide repeat protein, partial [Bacteroidia bacterium]|nr:tetratricopeptide repeat protein [Bacteroidia bacterium]